MVFYIKEVMDTCAKCNDVSTGGTIQVEGGTAFSFCKACSHILEHAPTNSLHDFITRDKVESLVAKNMRVARERRARGEFLWKNI